MLTELGRFLRIFRIDEGMIMKDMSERLGISVSHLSSIEHGKKELTEDMTERIKSEFELSPAQRRAMDWAMEQEKETN